MTEMELTLGIDQGSTQTRAAVCDRSGNILGFGRSHGACHSIDGMQAAMGAVIEASDSALLQSSASPRQVGLLFGGFTGADWPDEYFTLSESLGRLGLASDVRVVNDSIVALRGGTRASYGAIVIAGTGANCAILSPDGKQFIYHYYVDDYLQGGVGLGRSALRAVYRSATGRGPFTNLTSCILDALGFNRVDDLLRAQSERRLSQLQITGLAPLLFALGEAGDEVAVKIIRSFAEGLAELVTAGLRRFAMTGLEVEVVTSGSIFKGPGTMLENVMSAEIRKVAPQAVLVPARYEPVVGALIMGLEARGETLTKSVEVNIERTARDGGLVRLT